MKVSKNGKFFIFINKLQAGTVFKSLNRFFEINLWNWSKDMFLNRQQRIMNYKDIKLQAVAKKKKEYKEQKNIKAFLN